MKDIIKQPLYVIKHFIYEGAHWGGKPSLTHTIIYEESDLLPKVREIKGNYWVFSCGELTYEKSYFDLIFEEERIAEERNIYEKLKQKYENEKIN